MKTKYHNTNKYSKLRVTLGALGYDMLFTKEFLKHTHENSEYFEIGNYTFMRWDIDEAVSPMKSYMGDIGDYMCFAY